MDFSRFLLNLQVKNGKSLRKERLKLAEVFLKTNKLKMSKLRLIELWNLTFQMKTIVLLQLGIGFSKGPKCYSILLFCVHVIYFVAEFEAFEET